jgi:hypothetical protein
MVKLATKIAATHAQLQLKVTLREIRPAIWRRLLVPASIKLPKFHTVLQIAFDWTNSHLHAFQIGDQSYEACYPETWEDSLGGIERRDESKFRLCDLLHAKGDRLVYEYDFGDSWQHDVRVEKVLPVNGPTPVACVAGARAAPPEDCGSVPGYYNLVEAMADPQHPERRELLDWLGGPYDPEVFKLAAIDSLLKSLKI